MNFSGASPTTVSPARVEAAEPEVLEAWGEQVLTARSLDEVFGAS